MERSTIFKFGKPSISMGHLYHGYVTNNQRFPIVCLGGGVNPQYEPCKPDYSSIQSSIRGERPSCGIGAVPPAAPGTPGAGPAPGSGVIHGAVWILGQKELLLPGSSHESQLVSVCRVITYNTFTNWDTQEMGT